MEASGAGLKVWRGLYRGLLVIVMLLLTTAAGLASAKAEEPTAPLRIKQMEISVWPEYDDPRVLVIYMGEFADAAALPRQVTFRVPKGVAVNSTCGILPDGKHSNEVFTLKEPEDEVSALLSYRLEVPRFHLEYYYDPFQDQTDKSFTYQFRAFDPIDSLAVEVQQPLKASNFSLSPPSTSVTSDAQGFKYYGYTYQNVTAEQPIDIQVSYTKTDPQPSVAKGGAAAGASGQASADYTVVFVVLVVAVVAFLGYFAYSRAGRGVAPRRILSRQNSRRATPPGRNGGFCSSCGTPLEKADNFCPNCGKRTRWAAKTPG